LISPLHSYMHSEAMHPTQWWTTLIYSIFSLWLAAMIWSCVLAFRCILPFTRRGEHPAVGKAMHFHPAAIARAYTIDQTAEYAAEVERLGMTGMKSEISACMLIDSHISTRKYMNVTRSIRMLALSAVLALFYLVAMQF